MPEPPRVRAARQEDAGTAPAILYESAAGAYRIFGGGHEPGLALVGAAFRTHGTDTSCEVVCVAELEGRVVGAMAAFPAAEADTRRSRFLRLALRRRPPWRRPGIVRTFRLGAGATPTPPADAFYVDALATDASYRRRGVARALLAQAERRAGEAGAPWLALDTAVENSGARALYERWGFEATAESARVGPIPAVVGYVKKL